MTFKDSETEAFQQLFESHKSEIRHFPGCLHLELHRDANDPAIFCTYSHWESEAGLEHYRKSELFKKVWKSTKAMFDGKPIAFSNIVSTVVE